jgi:type IX secretion system PorP/SprF family membrane protein
MKKLSAALLFFLSLQVAGQNAPAFRQFYFNPYLFNAAYVGIDGYSEVFVYHRQQWLDFNNSPSASGFNLQYPTQNRTAFGFSFTNQEVVALQNSSVKFTFAYRLPISASHYFSFGISGGLGMNNLKLDGKDYSNDPTVMAALDNAIYAEGDFGALYTLGRLRIGFALPRLFGQQYFSPQDLGIVPYSQFRNQLYSLSYKFYFGAGNFALEPYALYRVNRDLQNFWEASAILYVRDKVWFGGSYNETQGIGFFLGMDIKEKVRIGYSYELPPVSPEFIAASSHEFHLQVRMGKKKIFKWAVKPATLPAPVAKAPQAKPEPKPEVVTAVSETTAGHKPRKSEEMRLEEIDQGTKPTAPSTDVVILPPAREEEVPAKTPETKTPRFGESVTAVPIEIPEKRITPTPVTTPSRQHILGKGHYVIVGSFSTATTALKEKDRLIRLGYDQAYMAQSPVNKKFYVYIFASSDLETARESRNYYRQQATSREAWVLTIE